MKSSLKLHQDQNLLVSSEGHQSASQLYNRFFTDKKEAKQPSGPIVNGHFHFDDSLLRIHEESDDRDGLECSLREPSALKAVMIECIDGRSDSDSNQVVENTSSSQELPSIMSQDKQQSSPLISAGQANRLLLGHSALMSDKQ